MTASWATACGLALVVAATAKRRIGQRGFLAAPVA